MRSIRRPARAIRFVGAAALAASVSAACDDGGVVDPNALPEVASAVAVDTAGPLFRSLRVELDAAAAIEVFYEPIDGGETFRMRSDSAALSHDILMPHLLADTTYRWAVRARDEAGRVGAIERGTFTTGPLPAELAQLQYTVEGEATFPLLVIRLTPPGTGFSGEVAMDPQGRIVWMAPEVGLTPTAIPGSHDMVFISNDRDGLVRMSPRGEIVAFLSRDAGAFGRIHHDIAVTDSRHVLFLTKEEQMVGDTLVGGDGIWEWDMETGETRQMWSAFDALDWNADRGPNSDVDDWLHTNSISIGPRGNVVLSFHALNQIASIAPDWGSFEWRLGGTNATIAVSPDDQFVSQHCAFELEDGHVLMFDNRGGGGPTESYTRGLELRMQGDTAVRVWEYAADPPLTATKWGSDYPLASGHRLIGFSVSPYTIDEVDASGQRVWRLSGADLTVGFRAVPWPDIAGEVRVEGMP